MGKTTYILHTVLSEAMRDVAILMVSPEVSRESLADKAISHQAGVNGLALRTGLPSDQLIGAVTGVAEDLKNRSIWVMDAPAPTVAEIVARLRKLQRHHRIALVVIDHLLRLKPTSNDENAERRIADMVRQIGAMARRERPLFHSSRSTRSGARPRWARLSG